MRETQHIRLLSFWLSVVFLSTFGTRLHAEFIGPISTTNSSTSYKVDRCAGLSLALATISPEDSEIYDILKNHAMFFMSMSNSIYTKEHDFSISDAKRKSFETIQSFMEVYIVQLNKSYISSGSYVDDLTDDDMQLCSSLRKRAQK